MKTSTTTETDRAVRDLRLSLFALALVFAAVLGGLAHDENWRKFWCVALAAVVYLSVLSAYARFGRRDTSHGGLAFPAFALAGAAAELASGWLRTDATAALLLRVAPLAACLVGGAHWLALQKWRPLRKVISGGRTLTSDR